MSQVGYWENCLQQCALFHIPRRSERKPTNREAVTVKAELSVNDTAQLASATTALRASMQELLISAFVYAMSTQATHQPGLAFTLEGHGREDEFVSGIDVTRTVGWFTSFYPVVIALDKLPPASVTPESLLPILMAVKNQLRAVPSKGHTFNLLRYFVPASNMQSVLSTPEAQIGLNNAANVAFNYLGQADESFTDASLGDPVHLGDNLLQLISANGLTTPDGRLLFEFAFATTVLSETINPEAVTQAFVTALNCFNDAVASSISATVPSDFRLLSNITQAQLDAILGSASREVEDMYPLTPLQEGMLFHTASSPGTGEYINQIKLRLPAARLDLSHFKWCWQKLVDRHSIFRTRFHWKGLAQPVQVVVSQATLPWTETDLRNVRTNH